MAGTLYSNWHLCAYRSAAQGIGATNVALTPVDDSILTVSGSSFITGANAKARFAFATGVGMANARLNTPSLRRLSIPSLQPTQVVLAPASNPQFPEYIGYEPFLPAVDPISVESTNTDAGAQDHRALLGLGFVETIAPNGPIWTIRGTGAITQTATGWVSGSLTLDQQLPAGRYAVVGGQCIVANGWGWRLIFQGATWRPGGISSVAAGTPGNELFRKGRLGIWGTFDAFAPPNFEVFGTGAGATQTVFLDVVPISDSMAYRMSA